MLSLKIKLQLNCQLHSVKGSLSLRKIVLKNHCKKEAQDEMVELNMSSLWDESPTRSGLTVKKRELEGTRYQSLSLSKTQ